MPQQFETKILVGRDELLRATRMASFFTQSKGGEVIFQIVPEKGRLTVVANSEDKGENVTEILVTGTGPNQEVVFNPRYILDGINAVATPFVKLMLNSGTAPVAIRPDDEKTGEAKQSPVLTYIIMPIRK